MKVRIKLKEFKDNLKFPCLMAYIGEQNAAGPIDTVVLFSSYKEGKRVVLNGRLVKNSSSSDGWISADKRDSWQPCNVIIRHRQ